MRTTQYPVSSQPWNIQAAPCGLSRHPLWISCLFNTRRVDLLCPLWIACISHLQPVGPCILSPPDTILFLSGLTAWDHGSFVVLLPPVVRVRGTGPRGCVLNCRLLAHMHAHPGSDSWRWLWSFFSCAAGRRCSHKSICGSRHPGWPSINWDRDVPKAARKAVNPRHYLDDDC